MCQKVLSNATDLAISKERFSQMTEYERENLQEFLLLRNVAKSRKRRQEVPNVLRVP